MTRSELTKLIAIAIIESTEQGQEDALVAYKASFVPFSKDADIGFTEEIAASFDFFQDAYMFANSVNFTKIELF